MEFISIIGIIAGSITILITIIGIIKYFWSLHRDIEKINDCLKRLNKIELRTTKLELENVENKKDIEYLQKEEYKSFQKGEKKK